MLFENAVGWLILIGLLGAVSACLVLPPLHLVDRKFPRGHRRVVRGLAILAGSVGLWYAIPLFVQYVYRRF